MIRRYNCDDEQTYAKLRSTAIAAYGGERGVLPRTNIYGAAPGLIPFGEACPDKLVDPADYKEVIAECHEKQIFPVYHQHASWAPPGFKWNQGGLNYCWAWSATAALMDTRASEGKPVPLLSPVSLGFLVNWRNAGNYLQSGIKGLQERGVCEMSYTSDQHSRSHGSYVTGWEDNALNYRLGDDEVWDTDCGSMVQHSVSILRTGKPIYIAYDWLSHALELVGLRWDEMQVNNLIWIIRNSHDEDDVIEMTGNRAVPDEGYGFRASKS